MRSFIKIGLTVFDQGVSSVTNLAGSVIAARHLSPDDFGRYGLVFVTYTIIVGITRAGLGDTLMLTHDATSGHRQQMVGVVGGAINAGLGSAILMSAAALILPLSSLESAMFIMAICLPGLLCLDAVRYVGFAIVGPLLSTVIDCLWLVLFLGIAFFHAPASPAAATLLWAGSGSLVGACCVIYLGARSGLLWSSALRFSWWRRHRSTSTTLMADYAVVALSAQSVVYIMSGLIGLHAVAGFRGSQVAVGPLNPLSTATTTFAVPRLRWVWKESPSKVRGQALLCVSPFAVVVLLYGVVLALLPDRFGVAFLGESWFLAKPLIPFMIIVVFGQTLNNGAILAIRVMGRAKRGLFVRAIVIVTTLTVSTLACLTRDVENTMRALAACSLFATVMWWCLLSYFSRRDAV